MADIVDKYRIESDTKAAQKDVEKFGKSSSDSFLKAQLAAQAMTAAFEVAVEFTKNAMAAVNDYERTVENQERALKSAGLAVDVYRAHFDRLSGELQKTAGISDEVLRELQTLALHLGAAPQDVDKFTKAAVRVSRVLNVDMTMAMQQVAKTLNGETGRLGGMIPGFKDLTKAQLRAGEGADLINEVWAEQLAVSDTVQGSLTTLSLSWDDYVEAVGLAASKSGSLNDVIKATNKSLEAMTTILVKEGVVESLAAAFDIAFFGGERTAAYLERQAEAAGPSAVPPSADGTPSTTASRKRRGKRGKKTTLPGYDQDDPMAAMNAEWEEAAERARAARATQEEVLESRAEREAEVNAQIEDLRKDHNDYLIALDRQMMKEQEASTRELMSQVGEAVGVASGLIENVIVAAASGSEEAMAQTLLNFVSMLGDKMVAMGTGHILEGIAMNAGAPGTGVPLMVAGGAEVAFGTAVGAGSAIASNAIRGDGGAATATAGMNGGAQSRVAAGPSVQSQGPVVFQIFGEPSPRMGKMMQDSIDLMRKRGLR